MYLNQVKSDIKYSLYIYMFEIKKKLYLTIKKGL